MSARSFRRSHARRVARERRRLAHARQRALVAGATLGATAVFAANAEAAIYTVNSTGDAGTGTCDPTGVCTLRDAVETANTTDEPDTVDLSEVSGTITLTQGVIGITDPGGLDIEGPGPGTLAVSGDGASGIFQIDSGDGAVSISGLTLTAGSSAGGGAIGTSAPLTLTNVTISRNTTTGLGGGVYSDDALTISGSTITGNTAFAGGGIFTSEKYDVVIENSTISGNTADTGGGIFVLGGSLSLTQSTISGNTSNQDGGGIHSRTKYDTTIDNSTIAQNAAADNGGGIFLAQYDESGTAAINSTIVAGNTVGGVRNDLFLEGTPAGGGFNNTFSLIENPGDAPLIGSQPITGVDPQLGPLADNGGPTETMLPADTSRAIDQGLAQGLTTDQRGQPRTINLGRPLPAGGDATDIGAVERPSSPPPPVVVTTPQPPVVVTTRCKSRRRFTIRLIERRGRLIRSAEVFVRGRRVAVMRRRSDGRLVAVVNLRGLPIGTYRVVLKARLRNGQRARWVRSYRTCIEPLPPSNDLDNRRAL